MIVYVRVTDGVIKKGDDLMLGASKERFVASETGIFSPQKNSCASLSAGEIGYIVTNIKKASIGTVGDSVLSAKDPLPPLGGYLQAETGGLGQYLPGVAGRFGQIPPIFGTAQVVGQLSFLRRRVQRALGAVSGAVFWGCFIWK